jgi:hypothetical protein
LLAQAGNADAPVIAFAAAVAQLLLQHIAEHAPAEVSSALSHQLKQQVSHAAADAAAAGRQFTITDALQQLLPQLSALATNASLLAHMQAAAAAAAAVFMPAESSTGCAGQLTLIDLTGLNNHNPAPHQYQQQQLCCSHLSAAHASTALVPSGCVNLPTAMAAMHPLLQRQQCTRCCNSSRERGVLSRYLALQESLEVPLMYHNAASVAAHVIESAHAAAGGCCVMSVAVVTLRTKAASRDL